MTLLEKVNVWEMALKGRNIKYGKSELNNGFLFTLGFDNLKMVYPELQMAIFLGDEALQTFVVLPDSAVDNEQRVLDFINRINYKLTYGCFEMDSRDSEVRFHLVETSDVLELSSCIKRVLDRQINLPVAMIKYFGPGFKRLLHDPSCTAELAINECLASD